MSKLSSNKLQEYNNNGYLAPIDVLTKDEVIEIRKEIEFIEAKLPDQIEKSVSKEIQLSEIAGILEEQRNEGTS